MKVGLCVIDMPATLGGGFVFRDEIARAALEVHGSHQFELIRAAPDAPDLRKHSHTFRGTAIYEPDARVAALAPEVSDKKIELLWFNHSSPVDVGVPYLLNVLDLQHRLQPWFPEVSANGQWDAREQSLGDAIKRAAIVTVGSQEAKEQLSFFYTVPLDHVYVVPFPTPQPAIDAAHTPAVGVQEAQVREKYGIKGDFLFYPAQFWAHKNHVNLLRALRILRREHGLALSLVLTGADHGNLAHVRNVAANLGIADNVHFLGFVPYEDVIAFHRFAFALSYVSFFGPENLPPLEALALGCPVVLSDIPGVRTLFGEGPILVDPRDDRSIAAGIKSLCDNPDERRERAEGGRQIAMLNTREQYMRNICAILDEFESIRRCWA